MPALTAAELALLRQSGQQTNLYLIVQQPMHRQADAEFQAIFQESA